VPPSGGLSDERAAQVRAVRQRVQIFNNGGNGDENDEPSGKSKDDDQGEDGGGKHQGKDKGEKG